MKIWWLQDTDEVFVQRNKPREDAVEVVRKEAVVKIIKNLQKRRGFENEEHFAKDLILELEKL